MTSRYRYLKKYYPPVRNFKLAFRFLSVSFLLLGLVLISNTVIPIFSYQLTLSPQLKKKEIVSPLGDKAVKDSLSFYNQVLGDQAWSADIKNWFSETPYPQIKNEEVNNYYLSIPKLKIFNAEVKVGVELNKSLIHYPGLPHPGKIGNAVIFGHSVLPAFFNPKNYMTIFSTLPTIKKGEQILIDYDGIRYNYLIEELKEVSPNDPSILAQIYDDSYISLVTCVPPGTLLRRLVVTARLMKQ